MLGRRENVHRRWAETGTQGNNGSVCCSGLQPPQEAVIFIGRDASGGSLSRLLFCGLDDACLAGPSSRRALIR